MMSGRHLHSIRSSISTRGLGIMSRISIISTSIVQFHFSLASWGRTSFNLIGLKGKQRPRKVKWLSSKYKKFIGKQGLCITFLLLL